MYPDKAEITEVGTRDGFQIEKSFIPTEKKIAIINEMVDAGIRRIEATSFVSPRAVPQLADAADVLAGIKRVPDLRIVSLVPNHQGAARAIAAGTDEIVAICSASESHNQANLNRSTDESVKGYEIIVDAAEKAGVTVNGAIAVAFGCPFEGNVDPGHVADIAARLSDVGVKNIALGDTTGMATPLIVEKVVKRINEQCPDVNLTLHFHNTRGIGLVNVMAGLSCGITRFESSIGGLGGCPFAPGASGNICTEDLIYMLEECGVETGVNLPKLIKCAENVQELLGRDLPGQVMKAGPRTKTFPLDAAARAVG